jgi:hypothetical protein
MQRKECDGAPALDSQQKAAWRKGWRVLESETKEAVLLARQRFAAWRLRGAVILVMAD